MTQQDRSFAPPSQGKRDSMPLFWAGMGTTAWFRLLARNRFRIGWRRWHVLLWVTAASLFHSMTRIEQWLMVGWQVKPELDNPPLFVLGHWRTGTTLLHELLVQDPRHTAPTTYECFAPGHFIISRISAVWLLRFLLPARRPMDNMPVGWLRPQEDEFALCNLGLPSPYLTMAFPNEPPQDQEFLTLEHVSPEALGKWKRTFKRFLCEIGFRSKRGRRIVLKSPPHTARVKVLLEMFPDAKFVHIVRDPCTVFSSTMHLWTTLYATQGLQVPNYAGLDERVLQTLVDMYRRFEMDRELIPAGNICEIRYEQLVADPLAEMERVYAELGLGGFENARPALKEFTAGIKGYETNRFRELSPDLINRIAEKWQFYADTYDYSFLPNVDAVPPRDVKAKDTPVQFLGP